MNREPSTSPPPDRHFHLAPSPSPSPSLPPSLSRALFSLSLPHAPSHRLRFDELKHIITDAATIQPRFTNTANWRKTMTEGNITPRATLSTLSLCLYSLATCPCARVHAVIHAAHPSLSLPHSRLRAHTLTHAQSLTHTLTLSHTSQATLLSSEFICPPRTARASQKGCGE